MGRSMWKGFLTLDLVSAPVKVTTAARAKSISFNQIHEVCGSRINQETVCRTCDRKVERDELVKGYEYDSGKYVIVTPDELKQCAPESEKTLEITEFVPANEVNPMLYESSYYLEPDGKPGTRPYELILAALKKDNAVGIGKITLSGREHVVAVVPHNQGSRECLAFHTLYYQSEVAEIPEFEHGAITDKELELAGKLVAAKSGHFDHSLYSDTYQNNVAALIESKREGKVVEIRKPEVKRDVSDDLEALLAASVEQQKKPAARATGTESRKGKKAA